ncbi:hypothetical protein EP47_14290 [Legionella norrlandica]|uniref:Uncharacterized protein n=1 Tax=Legionella norrlandica TaxID=1498499 RepID=A0A0A2ST10_9GAMM|nr:hypothetical protein [Legionella norrlandica]KGP62846.1 hypothetical protein EP47_14290 [Legionella norrlandica]
MKKILVYFYLYSMTSAALADHIVLNNETSYPEKGKLGTIAVQWAFTAEDTQKANKNIIGGSRLDLSSLVILPQKGQIQLISPNHAQYFRVMVWSSEKPEPDMLTNWVEIVPNKTYTVNQDFLIPAVLMSGAGC